MNFSILQGHTRSLVRFWRAEEGVIVVCGWDGSMEEDQKAILGYAFIINGGAISWSTKCQEIISLSTTESEYVAATYAAKEGLWLQSIILQVFNLDLSATMLFCDNQSAIALAK